MNFDELELELVDCGKKTFRESDADVDIEKVALDEVHKMGMRFVKKAAMKAKK